MSVQKSCYSAAEATAHIPEGATILVGGFGVPHGWPHELLSAQRDQRVKDLTLICNSPGFGPLSPQILSENCQIKKFIASLGGYSYRTTTLSEQIGRGEVESEMVPHGTLVERIRAGGAEQPFCSRARMCGRWPPLLSVVDGCALVTSFLQTLLTSTYRAPCQSH